MTSHEPLEVIFNQQVGTLVLVLKVTKDKLKLFLDAERIPVAGEPLALVRSADIAEALRPKVDLLMCNQDIVTDIVHALNRNEKVTERRIHKGTAPVDGGNGKVLFLVKRFSLRPDRSEGDGYVQLNELNLFENVKVGQLIARLYPPKPGIAGMDVFGKALVPTAGRPAALVLDASTRLQPASGEEYQIVFSEKNGYVEESQGKIVVKEELCISGDLDLRVGNLDFIGSIVINGTVAQGLTIKATLGITVKGGCLGATLITSDGDIHVTGFCHGGSGTAFVSRKNITLGIAHNIKAVAGGEIAIGKEAIDCELRSESIIRILTGHIVGGVATAACGIESPAIGTSSGKKTILELVSDIETSEEYVKVQLNIKKHERASNVLAAHLGPLAKNPARAQLLKQPYRQKMEGLIAKLKEVELSFQKLTLKRTEILARGRTSTEMRVNYLKALHSGTLLRAADKEFEILDTKEGQGSIDFNRETGEFSFGDLKPLSCSFQNPIDAAATARAEGASHAGNLPLPKSDTPESVTPSSKSSLEQPSVAKPIHQRKTP